MPAAERRRHRGAADGRLRDELKAIYLENMVSGEVDRHHEPDRAAGGFDLAWCASRAEPQPDGTYKHVRHQDLHHLGEHDMAENIVHLVLAAWWARRRREGHQPVSWCRSSW